MFYRECGSNFFHNAGSSQSMRMYDVTALRTVLWMQPVFESNHILLTF